MCFQGKPLPKYKASDRPKISNHPNYQYPNGKYAHGLKPENNPNAKICDDCGTPRGEHYVYKTPNKTEFLCPLTNN